MNNTEPKFCFACGKPIERKIIEGFSRYICTVCGETTYVHSRPCVGGLIVKGKQILLTRRKYPPFEGGWDIPGGFLESGEHPEIGLKRELVEELGMDVRIEMLLGIYMEMYGAKSFWTLNLFYQCHPLCKPKYTADDITEYQWFPIKKLPDPIAFHSIRKAIKKLKNIQNF